MPEYDEIILNEAVNYLESLSNPNQKQIFSHGKTYTPLELAAEVKSRNDVGRSFYEHYVQEIKKSAL